jgi:F0F1-type ATP synthase assembly protein I
MSDSPPENNSPKKEENIWRLIGRYSNLAFVLPAAIILGLIIGHLLDRWLGKTWITLAGLFVGCIVGFAELIRGIVQSSRDS